MTHCGIVLMSNASFISRQHEINLGIVYKQLQEKNTHSNVMLRNAGLLTKHAKTQINGSFAPQY